MTQDTAFGLRATREALGASQGELADTLGVTTRAVQKWEAEGTAPRAVHLACLYLSEHPEAIVRQRHAGRPRKAVPQNEKRPAGNGLRAQFGNVHL